MILLAGVRVDGIEKDVGVDVLLVHMDADDCLVTGRCSEANSFAISRASSGVISLGRKDWIMW